MLHLKSNSSHRIGNMKEGKRSSNTEQNAGSDLFLGRCQDHVLSVHVSIHPSFLLSHIHFCQMPSLWEMQKGIQPRSCLVEPIAPEQYCQCRHSVPPCPSFSKHLTSAFGGPGTLDTQDAVGNKIDQVCPPVADILGGRKGQTMYKPGSVLELL